ncbi:helix-turn-helix domain-containing protein [Actinomadura adrarensis]|uniref:Helix-turn-helix domain-containing protein n=1 Tax=Actinomadura adrarensis TaxID=1819600 RepID=A0ABW3CBD7_9ACTN
MLEVRCLMVRKYVPKKSARWPDKDKRMARAVELHAAGLSLRQIAERLVVSHQTVARDLARWDTERPNVTPLAVTSDCHKVPPMGRDVTPECDTPGAAVIQLRRSS